MLQVLASDCERGLQSECFVCTVALRLMENWLEAVPALFESLSAVLVLSVLQPVGTSFLSTNIFVEDDCGEGKNHMKLLRVDRVGLCKVLLWTPE